MTAELGLESTVFHELTHWGDALNGTMDMTESSKTIGFEGNTIVTPVKDGVEGGKRFERAAYGQDLLNGFNANGTATGSRFGDARNHVLSTNPDLADKLQRKQIHSSNRSPKPIIKPRRVTKSRN